MTILKAELENGLTIYLKEIHTAPIISHWVWYRVGSRNELPGKTGLSHWVEHMQFKGTPNFPSGILDKAISRTGGYWNAFTYLDWTAYFQTMPADQINLGLDLESDRMVNSLFEPKEVESERTVIISEKEGNDNEPLSRLGEAVQKAAFRSHPYQHEVIGEMEDLRTISRDDLYHHYQSHYAPNNALVAVAGDFENQEMLAKLKERYAHLLPADVPKLCFSAEQEIGEERQVEIVGPGETTFLQLAYRSPQANHDDFFSMAVLDSLLTGPSGLNMFGGGGISNKTSRLYRALVERELAVGVGGGMQATIDPFLYDIVITLRPEKSISTVRKAFDEEIARLQEQQVSQDEVRRAIKQAKALFAYGSENITNQAFWLGFAEMFATYDWFSHYLERLEMVTPADIQQAAQRFLLPNNRIVGSYVPEQKKGNIRKDKRESNKA
jgi:zinc protease